MKPGNKKKKIERMPQKNLRGEKNNVHLVEKLKQLNSNARANIGFEAFRWNRKKLRKDDLSVKAMKKNLKPKKEKSK